MAKEMTTPNNTSRWDKRVDKLENRVDRHEQDTRKDRDERAKELLGVYREIDEKTGEVYSHMHKEDASIKRDMVDMKVEMTKNTTRLTLVVATAVGLFGFLGTLLAQLVMQN